jgi:RNA polymerase sigma-70 factor (ECF subfamily)
METLDILDDAGVEPAPLEAHSSPVPTAEEVFRAYADRVYHLARRMVGSEADAEDITQDVLLQVVRKLPEFRGESALPTWLHRITVNAALSHRRKTAVREENRVRDPLDALLEQQAPRQGQSWAVGPEVQLLRREEQGLIDQAIADLPPIYRDVFVLSDVEGLPNATIADSLGLSLPAMKSRLHRARLLLRDALAPHFDESSN